MKKLIYCLMAMFAASVVTSCEKLREIGVLPEPTKYPIEMYVTSSKWGLDKTFISYDSEWYWNPVNGDTLEFRITENFNRKEGLICFGMERLNIMIPYKDGESRPTTFNITIYLQDIPLEENIKYYVGDTDGIDISDGIPASNYIDSFGTNVSYMALNMSGVSGYDMSTSGWIKFTRIELIHDNDEGYADDYEIDFEFEFEVKDPETGEVTLKVENGKILNNPGEWMVREVI